MQPPLSADALPTFWLGTHKPGWLARPEFAAVPLFVSRRTLAAVRSLPRASGPWALDSGGFTELSLFGLWTVRPAAYAAEVRRFRDHIGRLAWAAPQDWMCEPAILKRTGLSVLEHQRRTVANFVELKALSPDLPWVPVLQGFTLEEYRACVKAYAAAGIDLRHLPLVGLGTVCRRQNTRDAARIVAALAAEGLRLHGFGVKFQGLRASATTLVSADSLAWSLHARYRPPLPGHDAPGDGRRAGHRSCANCPEYALAWRRDLLARLGRVDAQQFHTAPSQGNLFASVSRNGSLGFEDAADVARDASLQRPIPRGARGRTGDMTSKGDAA